MRMVPSISGKQRIRFVTCSQIIIRWIKCRVFAKKRMTSLLATCNTLTQSGNQADTSDEGQMSKLHMWKDEGAFFVATLKLAMLPGTLPHLKYPD